DRRRRRRREPRDRRSATSRSQRQRTLLSVQTYVVRVWIPDRPGALGAVASRIGAVYGDVVGIDILERGADRAIDELTVELPEEAALASIPDTRWAEISESRPWTVQTALSTPAWMASATPHVIAGHIGHG